MEIKYFLLSCLNIKLFCFYILNSKRQPHISSSDRILFFLWPTSSIETIFLLFRLNQMNIFSCFVRKVEIFWILQTNTLTLLYEHYHCAHPSSSSHHKQTYRSIYLEKPVPQQTVCDLINNECTLRGLILKRTMFASLLRNQMVCQFPSFFLFSLLTNDPLSFWFTYL